MKLQRISSDVRFIDGDPIAITRILADLPERYRLFFSELSILNLRKYYLV